MMDKDTVMIKPYYLYTFAVPLQYNSFSIAAIEKDSEFVVGLDYDLEWKKDNILNPADINTVDENTVDGTVVKKETVNVGLSVAVRQYLDGIRNQYPQFTCRLTNIYNKLESAEDSNRASALSNEYLLSVNNLVAVSESKAFEILRDEITGLCTAISIILAQHNCNKHIFQPRVEPDWERKISDKKKILPEGQGLRSYVDKNGTIVHEIVAGIEVSVSCYSKMYSKMPTDEINELMKLQDAHFQYTMQEYCSALGTEGLRSKYFHLFCIIEFVEREYVGLAGTDKALSDKQVQELDKEFKGFLKNRGDLDKKTRDKVSSGLKGFLKNMTTVGRTQKLVNILHAMGIEEVKDGGIEFEVDKEFVQKHINTRNTLFHGNDAEKEIEKLVIELMCLDMKILEYIKGSK